MKKITYLLVVGLMLTLLTVGCGNTDLTYQITNVTPKGIEGANHYEVAVHANVQSDGPHKYSLLVYNKDKKLLTSLCPEPKLANGRQVMFMFKVPVTPEYEKCSISIKCVPPTPMEQYVLQRTDIPLN